MTVLSLFLQNYNYPQCEQTNVLMALLFPIFSFIVKKPIRATKVENSYNYWTDTRETSLCVLRYSG